jgi:methylmalonyl-CoA mutase N-terminal domain/subunit
VNEEKQANEEFCSWSGISLKQIYGPDDIRSTDYSLDIGNAGYFPFTRGIYPRMYRQKTWIARNLCGLYSPWETNERIKYLVKEGQEGVAVVPDTHTMLGIDGDHPLALASLGTQGVPLASLEDMDAMLKDIAMDKVSLSISICGISSPIVMAQILALADRRGVDPDLLRGSIQNDPIQSRHCAYDPGNPLEMCLRLAIDCVEHCVKSAKNWHPMVVNAYDLRESYVDTILEMGLALANAFAYIKEVVKRGVDIDRFAHRISIICGSHIDFFEQIAKMRAARRIWARKMKQDFGAQNERSMKLTLSVHTSGSSTTAQQPINNIIRGSYEALAAVLGGCSGLDLSCYDEPFCTPSKESSTVALRTQQIIQHELGVIGTADPLGGSYFVESLTSEIEKRILALLEEIDSKGGIIECAKTGWFKSVIDSAAYKLVNEVDTGEKVIVGVNRYQISPETENLLNIDTVHLKPCAEYFEWLKKFKKERNQASVKQALKSLFENTKDSNKNLMPYVLNAIKRSCTTGEIIGAIRLGYGEPYDPFRVIDCPFDLNT